MIQFEHLVSRHPEQVRDLLRPADEANSPSPFRPDTDGLVHRTWEVDESPAGSTVILTVWIGDGDLEAMAIAAADEHAQFERAASVIDTGSPPAPLRCPDWLELLDVYSRRIAAALADTD